MKYRYKPRRFVIKITRKIAITLCVIVVVLIAGLPIYQSFQPITKVKYKGMVLEFKHDVREAMKVPVRPSEEAVNSLILNPNLKNIFIIFKGSKDNALVASEGAEIAYKLTFVMLAQGYKVKFVKNLTEAFEAQQKGVITIFAREVASYENLSVDRENPTIALVPPALTNETTVEVENYVVFIKGKDRKEFELATVRFLLAALRIRP